MNLGRLVFGSFDAVIFLLTAVDLSPVLLAPCFSGLAGVAGIGPIIGVNSLSSVPSACRDSPCRVLIPSIIDPSNLSLSGVVGAVLVISLTSSWVFRFILYIEGAWTGVLANSLGSICLLLTRSRGIVLGVLILSGILCLASCLKYSGIGFGFLPLGSRGCI